MKDVNVCVDLTLDRELIDSNFDGYKLSLDPLATNTKQLETGPEALKLNERQYSLQHVKAFGLHNHLILDPWNKNCVFYIDSQWKICQVSIDENSRPSEPCTVLVVPDSSYKKNVPDRLCMTLEFVSAELATLADGAGTLYIIKTGVRTSGNAWEVLHSEVVLGEDKPFLLRSASLSCKENLQELEIILLHVDSRGDGFISILEWISFHLNNGTKWEVTQSRRLEGKLSPDYINVIADTQSLYVSGEQTFNFVYDSVNPVEEEEAADVEMKTNEVVPAYTWSQTDKDVVVQFTLKRPTDKNSIVFSLSATEVKIGTDDDGVLLQGELNAAVEVEASTWTISDKSKLELHLSKQDESFQWPLVVVNDKRGEMVISEEQAARIHEKLAHLTSEQWNPDPEEEEKPAYNSQQLEDCDAFPQESSCMAVFNGTSHAVTHLVNLGSHQWLFNGNAATSSLPSICLRHDVDAILWQPTSDLPSQGVSPWNHVATFNAFGYVQASKRQRKFTVCSPNYSFVAICDCVKHVYVYRQPAAITSPLRNRKTGRQVAAVAKQQVVALDTVEEIVGCLATDEHLFVLSGKSLHVIHVNPED